MKKLEAMGYLSRKRDPEPAYFLKMQQGVVSWRDNPIRASQGEPE